MIDAAAVDAVPGVVLGEIIVVGLMGTAGSGMGRRSRRSRSHAERSGLWRSAGTAMSVSRSQDEGRQAAPRWS